MDGIIIVVVAGSLLGAILLRRRSHNDVHSVEVYHRQIHTLEVINEHPVAAGAPEAPADEVSEGVTTAAHPHKHSYPEPTVRITNATEPSIGGPVTTDVPPIAPFEVVERIGAITFDDALAHKSVDEGGPGDDPAIGAMNHRPRRLLAPGLAVVAVLAFVAILLILGAHSSTPQHHRGAHASIGAPKGATTTAPPKTTTTTTAPLPIVSAPQATTPSDASYEVGVSHYTLVLSATTSPCWVSVLGPAGANIFTGVITPGQNQTEAATGLVSVEVGAPGNFAATINGAPVTLPGSYQSPLTLHFTPAASVPA